MAKPDTSALTRYDEDYHGWIVGQVALLEQRRFSALDVSNLVEELKALAASYRHAIESRLGVLLLHLLKWRWQSDRRSGSWESSIIEQRSRIAQRLKESPSLKSYPAEIIAEEYRLARRKAAAEAGLPVSAFPEQCPFTIEQVLDPDFLP
ncbi:MAG TPA: DUF29 domain-containing protein [Xanthobacteraceae bacterium]|jgi:hypothetical protein